ncbi:MAG: hypothetical protein RMJ88_07375 [Thermogemmata sp.]|nr:hypothetical protein [Thermogemmata sp.]
MKPSKPGTGSYLQLAFQIIEGPYKNRFLWTRLNLENPYISVNSHPHRTIG